MVKLLEQPLLPANEWGHEIIGPFAPQLLFLECEPLQLGLGPLLQRLLSQLQQRGLVVCPEFLFTHVCFHHPIHELGR